jgi:hypothetical protein
MCDVRSSAGADRADYRGQADSIVRGAATSLSGDEPPAGALHISKVAADIRFASSPGISERYAPKQSDADQAVRSGL